MRLTARLATAAAFMGLAALPAQATTVAVTAERMIDVATGARVEKPKSVVWLIDPGVFGRRSRPPWLEVQSGNLSLAW